jgi:hypothetical protein
MMDMETNQLSPIAEAIIDGYWTLCSGKDTIQFAIEDYLSRDDSNPWSPDGEGTVSPREFMEAIVEVMNFFDLTSVKDALPYEPKSRIEGLVSALRRHPVSHRRGR